jgi:O-antigen ligase
MGAMNNQIAKIALPSALLTICLAAFYLALYRPGLLFRTDILGAVMFAQLVLLALWKFRERFFPLMLLAFVWAGTAIPLSGAWNMGRWGVLAVGAIAGLVVYVRDHAHRFGMLHLMALFAVVAAIVSALVSSHPEVAILKAGSLFLLFLYAATGGRLAIIARELSFFSGLLLGCELLVYLCAVMQFLFRYALFGNPNSLGAVMGVAVAPLLMWGYLVSPSPELRRRRGAALALAVLLLLSTYSRASIAATSIAFLMLCIGLRRYKLLIIGGSLAVVFALSAIAIAPPEISSSSTFSAFVYKGHEESGAFGSRRSVWDQTVRSIRKHPWFGTGFGTSATNYDSLQTGVFASNTVTSREHGNSYLAISEWVGMLGVIPFFLLILLLLSQVVRVFAWMRRTGDPFVSAVPIAAVLTAGLVHAAFEDWMFAVGYYLCVFFWVLAFALFDVLPALAPAAVPLVMPSTSRPWTDQFRAAASGG